MQRLTQREVVQVFAPARKFVPIPLNETNLANYDLSIFSNPPFGPRDFNGVHFEMHNVRISMDHAPSKLLTLGSHCQMFAKYIS